MGHIKNKSPKLFFPPQQKWSVEFSITPDFSQVFFWLQPPSTDKPGLKPKRCVELSSCSVIIHAALPLLTTSVQALRNSVMIP